jgi:cholesterol transport system auxiliary component
MAGTARRWSWRGQLTVASLAASVLGGCSLLGGGSTPLATYDLVTPGAGQRVHATGRQVLVPEPTALKALDTERIVVRAAPSEIAYYPGAQWSDRLPRLIQNRLVEAFENSGGVRAGTPGQGLSIDYQVLTDLRAFSYDSVTKTGHVELFVKLMNDHDGKVIASQAFSGDAAVGTDNAASVTAALDEALATQLKAIVTWTARRL